MYKPVLAGKPLPHLSPVNANKPKDKTRWCFSFRFWQQKNYFGLDKSSSNWFVSLLEKLQILSEEDTDGFLMDSSKRNSYRYHEINWSQTNIPIQRKDFNWLHKDYLKNEEEYPFVQFQISKALGRIVGFFDEKRIFNILLLDPLHNIQPSKSHNYRVDPCCPLPCEHTLLLNNIDKLIPVKIASECDKECDLFREVRNIKETFTPINIVMLSVDDVDIEDADELTQNGKCSSYAEIFQAGIVYSTD